MTNANFRILLDLVHIKLHEDPQYKDKKLSAWNMTLDELLAINFAPAVNI